MQSSEITPTPEAPKYRSLFGIAFGDTPLVGAQGVLLTSVFSLTAHHLFSEDDTIHPLYIVGGGFAAFMIVTWEVKTLLKSIYWQRGKQFLRLAGVDIKDEDGERRKLLIAGAIRLSMAVILSSIAALCMSAMFFAKDIEGVLEREARQRNTVLEQGAAATIDARINDKKTALADARARATSLGPKVTALTIQAAHSRLRKDGLGQLPALQSALTGTETRVAQLQIDLDHLLATRADVIKAEVTRAPNYAHPAKGLLNEIEALEIIASENPHARAIILTFEATFLCLELALFASKLIDISPSGFAGHQAYKILSEARELAKKLNEELEGPKEDVLFPPPPMDDIEPPANDNNPPLQDTPSFGTFAAADEAEGCDDQPPLPPRRPRGRPRKDSYN